MRRTWFSTRSIVCHVTLVVLLVAFGELFAWQVRRATSGNELSWAYVVEWPIFAAYAVYMWWRLVHEETVASLDESDGRPAAEPPGDDAPPSTSTDEDAEELAAYNRYLAELNESGPQKRW